MEGCPRDCKGQGVSGRHVIATRTYLEMKSPADLVHGALPHAEWRVERMLDCAPEFWRFLYAEVGRDYHWVDRLPWSIDEIRAYIGDPAVSVWLFSVWFSPAGYFELRREADDIELVYFGMLRHFHGRGLGAHLLTQAVLRAWDSNPKRVWVHTNTLDHPAALPNYLKRGFRVFKSEDYLVDV
jgi:GNAT superfamily N-acetyltransferase